MSWGPFQKVLKTYQIVRAIEDSLGDIGNGTGDEPWQRASMGKTGAFFHHIEMDWEEL